MRIVFMGTPQFAVPTLVRLCEAGLTPVAIYAQPPRPVGRGLQLTQPPVAAQALARGLALRQPEVLQTRAELEVLRAFAPDVILTVAYGKIFRPQLLDLPRCGCVNLHPSLLPRYRGLSPIQRAILRGDRATGVTLYRMTGEVDAGPILAQAETAISPTEDAASLAERLACLGGELVCQNLRAFAAGELVPQAQDPALASFAPRLERNDGLLDWRLPARQIERLVRALQPWPGTFTFCRTVRVKVREVAVADETPRHVPPGTLLAFGKGRPPLVAALPGAVELRAVQPENCRPQDGIAFCCGQRLQPGCRLTGAPVTSDGRHG
jgi:methionyl-tRNA formyltransferase